MKRKRKLRLLLVALLMFMAALAAYKIFLLVHEADYKVLNAKHIDQIDARLRDKETFTFAVVGNIQNSMRIFESRLAPMIRNSDADFMVSVGNAVYDGAEDKYRLLYRGLKRLDIPYVLGVGSNEVEDFGTGKFYRHFGPYFFSFSLQDTAFIFLDSTGTTSWEWQIRWLRQELADSAALRYRFVFLNHSLFRLPGFDPDDTYLLEQNVSRDLQNLFSQNRVTMVFSTGYPTYHETSAEGVRYIVSGGGGGLLLGKDRHYQFVRVHVGPAQATCENVIFAPQLGTLRARLETLKLFLHSLFYMSLWNALLTLSILSLAALKMYSLIIRHERLYRDFSIDEDAVAELPVRVAMFTNNYLPHIGGVAVSINRLRQALVDKGAAVKLFAPACQQESNDPTDGSVVRYPALFYAGGGLLSVANPFSRKATEQFRDFECNLVHVHHPFWLGRKGLHLAKRRGLPVIFTYHTRIEHYTHYVPLPGAALKKLVAHFLIKHFANKCDGIIAPTSSTEEYLRNLGVSAIIEVIPTGIPTAEYRRCSPQEIERVRNQYVGPGERLLISVSRMVREKNLDFLIDGLAKVKQHTDRPFKCLLVGDGPERERLEAKVAELGMAGQIVFTGAMEPHEVVPHYLAADVFVFASISETQGMVLLEAMAGGCPVVAVRASGVYDIVKDGYNGLKVPESTDKWAEALASMLTNDQRLSSMSVNSQTFAETYSVEAIAERVLNLYRRVSAAAHRSEESPEGEDWV